MAKCAHFTGCAQPIPTLAPGLSAYSGDKGKRMAGEAFPRRRMLTKSTDCQRDEKACKTRKQTCRQGSLHGVSDRRLHVQLTQEAKIASDFSLFRAIFAFAGFVSALTGPDVFRPRIFIAAPPARALPGSAWTRQAFPRFERWACHAACWQSKPSTIGRLSVWLYAGVQRLHGRSAVFASLPFFSGKR